MPRYLLKEVVIAGAARTPTGKFVGALASVPAPELGAVAIRAAIERSGANAGDIDYTYMGNMLSAGLGQTPARQAAIGAGIPATTSAMTVNKACASGLAAVMLAAHAVQLGEADRVVAGGMENMSAAPHLLMNSRTGQRLGDSKLVDHMIHDGLWCPFENRHMGGSAEAIARKFDLGRDELDAFALRSQRRASAAVVGGAFDEEIAPVPLPGEAGRSGRSEQGRSGSFKVEEGARLKLDETPRADTALERLRSLKPVFEDGGCVTAGNSSGIADGAAAVVVTSAGAASPPASTPVARINGYAHAANEPGWLFDAPPAAVARLLERTGERLGDFDLIEVNEAFAAQVVANGRALGWDLERVNVWGGAIALGHPIGASGARILVTLLYGLRRTGGRKGLAVICHAGGGAMATSVERI
jgi:acetyl-CoA C-acetyltransferase